MGTFQSFQQDDTKVLPFPILSSLARWSFILLFNV